MATSHRPCAIRALLLGLFPFSFDSQCLCLLGLCAPAFPLDVECCFDRFQSLGERGRLRPRGHLGFDAAGRDRKLGRLQLFAQLQIRLE